jgi:rare lipoprotein A
MRWRWVLWAAWRCRHELNMSVRVTLLAILLAFSSCMQKSEVAPSGPPKFFLGDPYQLQGEWQYPQNFTSYDVTGLSAPAAATAGQITVDNETYDPNALAAASPVLPLPSIVTITNLVNGRSLDVRVNDRGPPTPGRVIAVTPKVASRLDFPGDGVVEVEVVLNVQKTAALDGALGQGPKLTAAPEAGIQAQSLAPPGGGPSGPTQDLSVQSSDTGGGDVGALSGVVTQGTPEPGPLYVQIPGFGRSRDADGELQQLYGLPAMVVPVFGGNRTLWAINIGPYHSVADADAALLLVLQRGVVNPDIIVR